MPLLYPCIFKGLDTVTINPATIIYYATPPIQDFTNNLCSMHIITNAIQENL